jgi:hypothetical protein
MEFLKNRNLAKSNTLNPGITLLTSCKGNSSAIIQGTFAHPDIAMAIAMWAHPPFLAKEILDGVFFSMKNQ